MSSFEVHHDIGLLATTLGLDTYEAYRTDPVLQRSIIMLNLVTLVLNLANRRAP